MQRILETIFSAPFLFSIIRVATPLLFVSMAALVSRKAGMLVIAFEGIMLFAALGGVIGSAFTQSIVLGVVFSILLGTLVTLLFAYFVLVLQANSILTGLAINIFGSGGTVFLLYMITGDKGSSTRLNSLTVPTISLPLIRDIPFLGQVLSGHNALTYLAVLVVIFVYIFINKSVLGLRIRSVGENPHAAESLGIDVVKIQTLSLVISGILASLGGAYMSMAYLPFFTRDMMAGRGFMAIAAQNLGGGNVFYTAFVALFFGMAEALSNVMQSLNLPSELMQAVPYIATMFGLLFAGQKLTWTPIRKKTNNGGEGKNDKPKDPITN